MAVLLTAAVWGGSQDREAGTVDSAIVQSGEDAVLRIDGSSLSLNNPDGTGILNALKETGEVYAADLGEDDGYTEAVRASIAQAAALMREKMKNREESIRVSVLFPEDASDSAVMNAQTEILLQAFAETGVGNEGRYLDLQTMWVGGGEITGEMESDSVRWTYLFEMSYYTSLAQEQELTARIGQAYDELAILAGSPDIDKAWAIYHYIALHVTYDYDHLNDDNYLLQYTPYAALCLGTSVCQGYTLLLYRMLWENNVDNACVEGIGNGGNHIWNIVRMGSLYYNCDVTWDSPTFDHSSFFLKSDAAFSVNHTRSEKCSSAEFYERYPMSEKNYPFLRPAGEYKYSVILLEGDEIGYEDLLYWFAEDMLENPAAINIEGSALDFEGSNLKAETEGRALFVVTEEGGDEEQKQVEFTVLSRDEAVLLPDDITQISEQTLQHTAIQAVVIPDGCQSIGDLAFADTPSLGYVYIPDSVTQISNDAFTGSENVIIFCPGENTAMSYAREKGLNAFILETS